MKTKALQVTQAKAAYSEVTLRLMEYLNGDLTREELEMILKSVQLLTNMKSVQIKEGLAKTFIAKQAVSIVDIERFVGTSADPEAPKFE